MTDATNLAVTIRVVGPGDRAALARAGEPATTGAWDTYDDPPEETLDGSNYEGGARVVELDGDVVGTVSYIRVPYGPNRRSLAFKIGVVIFPEYRRRGVGSRAQRLLADELFATSDANRVEADTDVENVGERRALERAGFALEGVLRGAQWRDGRWHDQALYGRLRDDE